MALIHILILLRLILVSNCIQFEVPEVADVVGKILDTYEDYVQYNRSSVVAHKLAVQGVSDELQARQATPYWYEEIPHQGVAAFGPAGYQVYRNVKDYGAKGTPLLV